MQHHQLMPIQNEKHFDKKLSKSINDHNAELARLDAIEAGIPNRKRILAGRVLAGAITGKDALAELREIQDSAVTVDIDRRPLLTERERLSPLINAAHEAESKRLAIVAEKRKAELLKKLDESGLKLNPLETANTLKRDGEYSTAERLSRRWLIAAGNGTMHPDAIRGWPEGFARLVHAQFGPAAAAAPTRTVETGKHGVFGI